MGAESIKSFSKHEVLEQGVSSKEDLLHQGKSESPAQVNSVAPREDREQVAARIAHLEEEIGTSEAVKNFSNILDRLKSVPEDIDSFKLWPKESILAGGPDIENQEINLIRTASGDITINFILAEGRRNTLEKALREGSGEFKQGEKFTYESLDGEYYLVDAWQKEASGFLVQTSEGKRGGEPVQSGVGVVRIRIPKEQLDMLSGIEIGKRLETILKEDLGISTGLQPPTEAEIHAHKEERYKLFHKGKDIPTNVDVLLERKEVFPGYHTMVEKGVHQKYMPVGSYAVYHTLSNPQALSRIIKEGGLVSTHERLRRGYESHGRSPEADLRAGGADSVFTRMLTKKNGLQKVFSSDKFETSDGDIVLVFKPEVIDRTDWYGYDKDIGATDSKAFAKRLSPEDMLKKRGLDGRSFNEQMFKTGISFNDIAAIHCANLNSFEKVKQIFRSLGMEEINGKKLNDFVVSLNTMEEVMAVC